MRLTRLRCSPPPLACWRRWSPARRSPGAGPGAGRQVRPAPQGRPRHRRAQQHRRRARRGHRRREDRAGRGVDPGRRRRQDHRRVRPLRHARPDRHPRPRLHRHRRAELLRRRQQRLPRRLHASASASRPSSTPAAPAGATSRTSRTGSSIASRTRVLAFLNIVGNGMRGGKFESDQADMEAQAGRGDGPEAQGDDRRHQDRALHRAGVDAGRSRRRGRHRGRTSR